MKSFPALCFMVCTTLIAQRAPSPTDLASHPFFIKKSWVIGGVGDWDSLAMDPKAGQIFISHGTEIQVVDVTTGTLAGAVTGFREAHSIALDPEGAFGYATDGPASQLRVFDRRSLQVVATIPTGPSPRAIVLEPQTALLFAVGSRPIGEGPTSSADGSSASRAGSPTKIAANSQSTVTVIDSVTRKQLAQIVLSGALGSASADGNGGIYITVVDHNQIARLDAVSIANAVRRTLDERPMPETTAPGTKKPKDLVLDWTASARPGPPPDARPRLLALGSDCQGPRALAVDFSHQRLFASCTNMKMVILNAETGEPDASVPIGPGADALGFDSNRGLLFSANGGGDGSLTIIRQDVTDTYAVTQILPTRQRARTLAINSSTGEIYIPTILSGATLGTPPANGMGTLKMNPIDSTFQILVIGN